MLRLCMVLVVAAFTWAGKLETASAQHEHYYEFRGTHVALSVDRFSAVDYTDFEGPGGSNVTARVLLNADERVPTSYARFGIDVFLERFSLGVAGGATSRGTAVVAPRIGYMFGITPQLGIWLRGGGFLATLPSPASATYFGVTAEALFAWFPINNIALSFGPTFDAAFGDGDNLNYIAIGIPQISMHVFLD